MNQKFSLALLLVILLSAPLHSQDWFGVKGGLNFDSLEGVTPSTEGLKKRSGYHLGITSQLKIPLIGLAIQPELLFVKNRAEGNLNHPESDLSLDYLTLPLNIQLGLDLLLFRPFVMFSPYISYAIGKGDALTNMSWDSLNRFNYGYGIGGGIDIWRLQVSGKFIWGLGKIQKLDSPTEPLPYKNATMEGFQLSVAWFF